MKKILFSLNLFTLFKKRKTIAYLFHKIPDVVMIDVNFSYEINNVHSLKVYVR